LGMVGGVSGATRGRGRVIPCKDEQQSRVSRRPCPWERSRLTQKVRLNNGMAFKFHLRIPGAKERPIEVSRIMA